MLVHQIYVYPSYIQVKFESLVEIDSIQDASFTLLLNEVEVDGFLPIDIARDYNSISRSLYLRFNMNIVGGTVYTLHIEGLTDIFDNVYDPEDQEFRTKNATSPTEEVTPLKPTFYIEDHTVAPSLDWDSGGFEQATPSSVPTLEVVDHAPAETIFVTHEEVDGTDVFPIRINFNYEPNLGQLTDIILIQKKKLGFIYSGWEDVQTIDGIEASTGYGVEFSIPAEDSNYKYRIVIPKALVSVEDIDIKLFQDFEFEFTTRLSPFYSNPDEIMFLYGSTISEVEVAQIIQRYSLEAQSILKLPNDADPTFLAVEYVTASVLCYFAKKYDSYLSMGSNANEITLGDFQVSKKTGSFAYPGKITRDNASNWCELAQALKRELNIGNRVPRNFVKAGRHKNPIPSRYFKDIHTYKTMKNPTDSGLLND